MDSEEFKEQIDLMGEIANEKKRLEKRLEEISEIRRAMQPDLVKYLYHTGTTKVKTDKGHTIFVQVKRFFKVSKNNRQEAVKILNQYGLGFINETKPSDKKLGDWIKEQNEDELNDPETPDFLKNVVDNYTETSLGIRGATA